MTPSELTIHILAFIGLISCILFGAVWICAAFRILWVYANYSASKAIKAHRFAMRTKARTKAAWKQWGIDL